MAARSYSGPSPLGSWGVQNAFALGLPLETRRAWLEQLTASPDPLAGGDGAHSPSPRTRPPLSASKTNYWLRLTSVSIVKHHLTHQHHL